MRILCTLRVLKCIEELAENIEKSYNIRIQKFKTLWACHCYLNIESTHRRYRMNDKT